MDIKDFVREHNVTMHIMGEHGLQTDADKWQHFRYTVRIKHAGRSLVTAWRAGTGLPLLTDDDVAQVLDSLRSDASAYVYAGSFEEFAAEFGYDTDSRTAEKTWRACGTIAKRLERVLGGELYRTLLEDVEPM